MGESKEKFLESRRFISPQKTPTSDFNVVKVLITAGPTREYFDPVRFLSNPSTGKMGYALAQFCAEQEAMDVTLISGPVSLECPKDVKRIMVETGEEMYQAVSNHFDGCDLFIAVAAVMDFRPAIYTDQKFKKDGNSLQVNLLPTKDILKEMSFRKKDQILVGFSAETNDVENNALAKMNRKDLHWIVANQVGAESGGFGRNENSVLILGKNGERWEVSSRSKYEVARQIIQKVIPEVGLR